MLIFIFLKLLGSLALFLYGVNILNKGARSCFAESYVAVNLWMSRRGRKFHPSHVSFLSKIVEIGATMSLWLLAVLGFGLDVGLFSTSFRFSFWLILFITRKTFYAKSSADSFSDLLFCFCPFRSFIMVCKICPGFRTCRGLHPVYGAFCSGLPRGLLCPHSYVP